MSKLSINYIAILLAALLWFVMFSPWTAIYLNFWLTMSCSALLLTIIAFTIDKALLQQIKFSWKGLLLGMAIATVLWCVFWIGDKLSQIIFSFARSQVDNIYAMKEGNKPYMIGALLLCLIGPAEEIFWRGFLQRRFSEKMGANVAMVVTLICYTLIHIWSFNFMLIMAAFTAGLVWGLLYRLIPNQLFALVVSHAIWDLLAFVIIPL